MRQGAAVMKPPLFKAEETTMTDKFLRTTIKVDRQIWAEVRQFATANGWTVEEVLDNLLRAWVREGKKRLLKEK